MMPRQTGNCEGMAGQDRQNGTSHGVDSGIETIEWEIQPACTLFDGDFPRRDSTDQHLIFEGNNDLPDARFKPERLCRRPKEDVGVEQQIQGPEPSNA